MYGTLCNLWGKSGLNFVYSLNCPFKDDLQHSRTYNYVMKITESYQYKGKAEIPLFLLVPLDNFTQYQSRYSTVNTASTQ